MTVQANEITRELILESIKLLKDWATWLVTIQTASIAALATLIGNDTNLAPVLKVFVVISSFYFIMSIIVSSYLLVCLPGFYRRLPDIIKYNKDFLQRPAFISALSHVQRIKVIWLVGF